MSDGVNGCVQVEENWPFINAGVKINGTYYRDLLLTQKLLPAMREICVVFFIWQCSCCCSPSLRDNQPSGTTDTCFHFIRPLATQQGQQHRSEPTWPQNMRRNAAAGLPRLWRWWTEVANRCLAWFWAKCHQLMTQLINGTNVSVWIFVWKKRKFWAFSLTPYNAYVILHIIFVNFVNNKQAFLCYVQQNFANFGLLYNAR